MAGGLYLNFPVPYISSMLYLCIYFTPVKGVGTTRELKYVGRESMHARRVLTHTRIRGGLHTMIEP